MTEAIFWNSWLAVWLMAGPIVLCIGNLAFSFYLSNHHLDTMLGALKNSRHVVIASTGVQKHDWFQRFLLVSKITGLVMWPGPGVRSGEMYADEIERFPSNLKRLLKLKVTLTLTILIWGSLVFLMIKLK